MTFETLSEHFKTELKQLMDVENFDGFSQCWLLDISYDTK